MERRISEADWRIFKEVRVRTLERFCDRVLSEVGSLAAQTVPSSHERYLAVYKLLQKEDKQLGDTFDDNRRSTALFQLARMRSLGLVADEEFARFSSETQDIVTFLLE